MRLDKLTCGQRINFLLAPEHCFDRLLRIHFGYSVTRGSGVSSAFSCGIHL
jgi:hypothetical protein